MKLHPYSVLFLGGVAIALFAGATLGMTAGVLTSASGLGLFVAAGAIYTAGLLLGRYSAYQSRTPAPLRVIARD